MYHYSQPSCNYFQYNPHEVYAISQPPTYFQCNPPHYSINYLQCNVECSEGVRVRSVTCRSSLDGRIRPDSECDSSMRLTAQRSCSDLFPEECLLNPIFFVGKFSGVRIVSPLTHCAARVVVVMCVWGGGGGGGGYPLPSTPSTVGGLYFYS